MSEYTVEELVLLKRLSVPPTCMHDPDKVIDHEKYWKCGQCGLIAKKTISEWK